MRYRDTIKKLSTPELDWCWEDESPQTARPERKLRSTTLNNWTKDGQKKAMAELIRWNRARGSNQGCLAKGLGMAEPSLSNLKSGKNRIGREIALRITSYLRSFNPQPKDVIRMFLALDFSDENSM